MNIQILKRITVILMCTLLFSPFTFGLVPAYAKEAALGRTPSGIPISSLEQEIDKYVQPSIGSTVPGAAVVVTKDDQIVFSKGYGYANLAEKIPVNPATTVFEYGSINKLFVWTAVMQLVEKGDLKLDQDIKTYLPEKFASKLKYKKTITMLDIMNHTAGFEEYTFGMFAESPDKLEPLEEALLSSEPKQAFEPGTVMSYSNFATSLAAYTVEQLSGQSFSDYEMNEILRPLGMNQSSGHPRLADNQDLLKAKATGYVPASNGEFEPASWANLPLYPSGAINGTAEDLAQYAMALTADTSPLFSKQQTLQTMFTQSYTPQKGILSVAHGFWEFNAQPHALGHEGNTMGFSSNFIVVPEEKLGIVVLTNAGSGQDITSGIAELLIRDNDIQAPTNTANLPSANEIAGQYIFARNSHSTIHEFLSYLTLINIKTSGESGLTVDAMGMTGEYSQVSPYLFKLKQTDSKLIEMMAPILYADVSDGKVSRLSTGQITDLLPVEPDRSTTALIVYAAIAAVSLLFFLLAPLVLFVRWILRRKKGMNSSGKGGIWHGVVLLCGTALAINNLLLIMRSLNDMFATAAMLNFYIILNWVFGILASLFLVIGIFSDRGKRYTKAQKLYRIITVILLFIFMILLVNWNFFSLIS